MKLCHFIVMLMDLKSVIQSEGVRKKKKIHMKFRRMVLMNLFAGQE